MRRFLLALVIVSLLGPTASRAAAQTNPVVGRSAPTQVVEGFLYWTWASLGRGYRYTSLNAYDFEPGTRLSVACADPAAPCKFRPAERMVGAGRQVSL